MSNKTPDTEKHLKKIRELFLLISPDNTDEKVNKWLNTENDHFGGSKPIDVIESGRGHKVVTLVEALVGGY